MSICQSDKVFHSNEKSIKRSKTSWKRVTDAENFFLEGNTEKALPTFFQYENCEARAMFFLAYVYFEGCGAIQDMNKGVTYLKKLAEFKNYRTREYGLLALVLYYLGELYYKGFIFPKDDSLAKRHWVRGAKLNKDPLTELHYYGSVQCQSSLGMYYSHPDHLNLKKAFTWHKIAEKSGNLLSSGALGVMYLHGIGTQKNLELAYKHLTSASERGNTYAKGHLTSYYYKMKMFDSVITIGKELATEDNFDCLAKQQNCPKEHIRTGIAMGCYYLALCINERRDSKESVRPKDLIKKAVILSPSIAYDIHAKAILGIP